MKKIKNVPSEIDITHCTIQANLATMYHLILSHISRKSRDWFLKEGQIVCQSPLTIDFFVVHSEILFSNFSCVFLSPNIFFQFEF